MAYWIFKTAEQELYPDIPGDKYVYDNTHSIRVCAGDNFLYLDKRSRYSFTAAGVINRLSSRTPTAKEKQRTAKVTKVFTAHLSDVIWFETPLSISPTVKEGKKNRALLGIQDANLLGWSQSMPALSEAIFQKILDLADIKTPAASPDMRLEYRRLVLYRHIEPDFRIRSMLLLIGH